MSHVLTPGRQYQAADLLFVRNSRAPGKTMLICIMYSTHIRLAPYQYIISGSGLLQITVRIINHVFLY